MVPLYKKLVQVLSNTRQMVVCYAKPSEVEDSNLFRQWYNNVLSVEKKFIF